jgi:hypothetical protein
MRLATIAVLAALAACQPAPRSADPGERATPAACADGGARLEGTGLCQAEAAQLVVRNPDVRVPELAAGCDWAVNETMLPGDQALLYYAARCNGATSTLEYAGGAHSAEISSRGRVVMRLFGAAPDPRGAIRAAIEGAPANERASCEIVSLAREGWPKDALFIAPNAAARAKLPKDKPVVACGPMGLDETRKSYWRVVGGFPAFIDEGTSDPDVDLGNIAVVAKGAEGTWAPKT